MSQDRLVEIKATRRGVLGYPDMQAAEEDIDWLIGEVERLRVTALKSQPLPADTSTTSTEDASAGASTQEAP